MSLEKDKKYWKDYIEFINNVEHLTGSNPGDLLSQYKEILATFISAEELFFKEWQWEFEQVLWLRQKIQELFESSPFKNNLLFFEFKEEIQNVDIEIKNYVQSKLQDNWWDDKNIIFNKIIK